MINPSLINPEVNLSDATVIGTRVAAKGNVVIQLIAGSNKEAFLKKVDVVIEGMGRVKVQRVTLELRGQLSRVSFEG